MCGIAGFIDPGTRADALAPIADAMVDCWGTVTVSDRLPYRHFLCER